MIGHVMTLQIFGAPKSCALGGTLKRCLIDSTLQVELKKKKGSREKSREVQDFLFAQSQRRRKARSFNQNFLRVKHRCGLVIRLKANKF